MNIYCNGDSYTSGQEILDYQFTNFPGYDKTGSPGDRAAYANKHWANIRIQQGINFYGSYDKFLEEERKFAWPGQIKKIDKSIECINGGRAGSSIIGISNRTMIDLLKHKDKKFDLVFIQLTSPTRVEFYNWCMPKSYYMRETALGWIEFLPKEIEKQIAKGYSQLYNDADFSIKYLYSVVGLKNLVKGITGKNPIFLFSLKILKNYILDPLEQNTVLKNSDVIQSLIRESSILEIPEENFMEHTQIKNNFLYTPLKHFELKFHEEFAKLIYSKYLK
jgi:hypothetical protein